MVVICAKEDDRHAVAVATMLESRHGEEVFVFDTSSFPTSVALDAVFDERGQRCVLLAPGPRRVQLDEVTSFWWRRPQPMAIDPRIVDPTARNFAFQECVSALFGVLACCPGLWVNDVGNDTAAEYKPYQLKVAGALGLRIPATLITNEPARAVEFWRQERGAVVFKAFNQRGLVWRPTRLLREEDLALIDHVRHAPVIFQSLMPGVRDVRVTVVGDTIFATEFDIEGLAGVDYRVAMADLPCRTHALPQEVDAQVRALMLMRAFRLEYAGIDFRLTAEGAYVFLEVNTAGEFLYVQDRTGQPIAEAMAAHLAGGKPTHSSSAPWVPPARTSPGGAP